VFLIAGIFWIILAVAILRFTLASVTTVGILVGALILIAGIDEFFAIAITSSGWKWVHGALGVLFVIFGLAAMFYPGQTFLSLTLIVSWVLVFKGTFDIVLAILTRRGRDLWWLGLFAGLIELGLAFWASGNPARSAYIVIVWAGVWALLRGITEIVLALEAHAVHKSLVHPAAAPSTQQMPQAPLTGQSSPAT
jgi:uncharacterized membrane protein HdeD (DUF308 family)